MTPNTVNGSFTANTGYWPTYTIGAAVTNTAFINNNWTVTPQAWQWPPATLPPATLPPRFAQPLGFNKYVNASDLLEEFIAFLGSEGVRKSEIMDLPVELFIKWLIIRACEVDQEEPGIVLALPAPKPLPRCLGCGRWMKRATILLLHGDRCAQWHFARAAA